MKFQTTQVSQNLQTNQKLRIPYFIILSFLSETKNKNKYEYEDIKHDE
jgi:hypothetical protein